MKRADLKKIFVLLTVVAVVFFFYRLLKDINRPYGRPWEHGYQDIIGRNHLKYGLKETKGLIVMGERDGELMRRFNHPPLLHLSVAGFLKVFGSEEWAARLLPIISSVLALLFIYLIAENLFNKEKATLAVFFASIMPMFNYFGQVVNFEPSTLLFSLIYFYSFLKLNKGKWYNVLFYFSGIVSFLLDWPAYLLIGWLAFYSFFKDKKKLKATLIMVFLSIIFVMTYVSINRYYTGQIEIIQRGKDRGEVSLYLKPDWYTKQVKIQWDYFGMVMFFVLPWLVAGLKRLSENRDKSNFTLKMILFLWPLSYLFVFSEAAWTHDFWHFYFVPIYSMAAGSIVYGLFRTISKSKRLLLLVTLFGVIGIFYFFTYRKLEKKLGWSNYYYETGSFIENNSEESETLFIANSTVAYHSKRTISNVPGGLLNRNEIKIVDPDLVSFGPVKQEFNIQSFLAQKDYVPIFQSQYIEVWKKKNQVLFP